jgi:hypothetical protein
MRRTGVWTVLRTAPTCVENAQLALVFGPGAMLEDPGLWDELRTLHPDARIVACSTAGEIAGKQVQDDTVVVTDIALEHGTIAIATATYASASSPCVTVPGGNSPLLPVPE